MKRYTLILATAGMVIGGAAAVDLLDSDPTAAAPSIRSTDSQLAPPGSADPENQ